MSIIGTAIESSADISSLSEFIKFVKDNCSDESILFRGHREDYPLLPKIARLKTKGKVTDCEKRMLGELKNKEYPLSQYQNRK